MERDAPAARCQARRPRTRSLAWQRLVAVQHALGGHGGRSPRVDHHPRAASRAHGSLASAA
eukprot:12566404-Alexandrium_andersonii.AAC.1